MNVTVKIEGIDKLTRKLGKAEGIRYLRAPMERVVFRIQGRMAQYPAQRPGSKYTRTYNLGRSWTKDVQVGSDAIYGKVGNNVKSDKGIRYAPLVQSYRFQASIHRGRWINTDKYVIDTERRNIERDFKQAVDEALR